MSVRGEWSMYRPTIHACIVPRYIDVSTKDTTCTEKRYNPHRKTIQPIDKRFLHVKT